MITKNSNSNNSNTVIFMLRETAKRNTDPENQQKDMKTRKCTGSLTRKIFKTYGKTNAAKNSKT